MNQFIEEFNLKTTFNGPTFINVYGVSVNEIDFFLYSVFSKKQKTVSKLVDITTNVSDHYPYLLQIECHLTINFKTGIKSTNRNIRIK